MSAARRRRPARPRGRAAALALALVALLAGCGSSGVVEGGNNAFSATTLTVYTDLPLLGPDRAIGTSIANGEELALYQAGGHVGQLHISIQELDGVADPRIVSPVTPSTSLQTADSAHSAASDLSTIAYIGDLYSPSTALSLPLNNENGILQLSPGSSYSGFTDPSSVAPKGGPSRWYPNGTRTFARLVPADTVEAKAMLSYMRSLGVSRLDVVSDAEYPPFDSGIAHLVAADAPAAKITLAGRQTKVSTSSVSSPARYAQLAASIAATHADGVLLGAAPNTGADALFQELHAKLPKLKLFAASTLATPTFLAGLGPAASATYVTSPMLEPDQYPPAAQAVFARYRSAFPGAAVNAYVLYGYEAMSDVLRSIKLAGRFGARRQNVIGAFFNRLGARDGVLGSYTINAHGDTSLARFDGYRAGRGGTLVLVRPIN
jgi:branched-chain amino acid transport system substrate-binding protein